MCWLKKTSDTEEYMILKNKSPYFTCANFVVVAVEQWNTRHIATMLQWSNEIGYPTAINEPLNMGIANRILIPNL